MAKYRYVTVKAHYRRTRSGKRALVKAHKRRVKKALIRTTRGEKFRRLQKQVALHYVGKKVEPKYQRKYGKTYSKKEAMEVGRAVAGKVFWKKYGKKRGRAILKRER